ncbi:elastin-like [Scleropages formosus]|uniref:elastin-like n=1 Tax=Scleropages formosus TaxID=113540 RepID=UPI0008785164|nr:elastin-like [Scleropages formosus]
MVGHALLQMALVLCLTQRALQGGVPPLGSALGRLGPGRGETFSVCLCQVVSLNELEYARETCARERLLDARLSLSLSPGAALGPVPGAGGVKAGGPGPTLPLQGGPGFGAGRFPSGPFRGVPFRGRPSKAGRYPGAQFGMGAGLGPGLGTALGNGLGVGQLLGKQRGGYGAKGFGYGGQPLGGRAAGVAPQNGQGAKATKAGYGPWTGGYPGAGWANGYGPGVGPGGFFDSGKARAGDSGGAVRGGYPGGGSTNGYGTGAAGLGEGGKARPAGYGNGYGAIGNGYGNGVGYPTVLADAAGLGGKAGKRAGGVGGAPGAAAPQLPYGGQPVVPAGLGVNGKADRYGGAQPSYGRQPVQPLGLGADGDLGALGVDLGGGLGLDSTGKYGSIVQMPYNGLPVVPAGLDGNGGYPYDPQTMAAEGKVPTKYGTGTYGNGGVQPAAYSGPLAAAQGPYGGKESKFGLNGFLGNGYRG